MNPFFPAVFSEGKGIGSRRLLRAAPAGRGGRIPFQELLRHLAVEIQGFEHRDSSLLYTRTRLLYDCHISHGTPVGHVVSVLEGGYRIESFVAKTDILSAFIETPTSRGSACGASCWPPRRRFVRRVRPGRDDRRRFPEGTAPGGGIQGPGGRGIPGVTGDRPGGLQAVLAAVLWLDTTDGASFNVCNFPGAAVAVGMWRHSPKIVPSTADSWHVGRSYGGNRE